MGETLHNWRIVAATIFAGAVVAGAYALATQTFSTSVAQASTETAILQAIATKDSDNDGLPDWEEALYGTDSQKPDTRGLGMTDGEAVAKGLIVPAAVELQTATSTNATPDQLVDGIAPPADGSLTDAFAKNFFTLYLTAKQQKNGDLTEQETSAIAQRALSGLAEAIKPTPDFKTKTDVHISGSGPDALRAFAISVERIMNVTKGNASKSEILYLKDAVENGDASALAHLNAISKSYRDFASGLAKLPVPQELASVDLALINALMRISQISSDFAKVQEDPLTTILALQQYPQAVLDLGGSFIAIDTVYKKAGLVFTSGTPGSDFVNLMKEIADTQEKTKP